MLEKWLTVEAYDNQRNGGTNQHSRFDEEKLIQDYFSAIMLERMVGLEVYK